MNYDLQQFEKNTLQVLLTTQNNTLAAFEDEIKQEEYFSFSQILQAHNIVLEQVDEREKELNRQLLQIEEDIKIDSECDKWDYIFACSSGVLAGLIDSFFVGSPKDSKWLSSADKMMDNLVEKFAKANGWQGPKEGSTPVASAIGFLERKFPVNYDHRLSTDVSGTFEMLPSNHHLKSLSHALSPIGLIFSIVDQFKNTATFYDNGYLITIDSESKLHGANFPSKLFAAFMNWIGHIMSDIAGSSGGRRKIDPGRGSGIPIPFYELLQGMNIGSFNVKGENKTLAEVAVKVFEQGYDFRFGMVQCIPVLMLELFIRIFCIIRHRFQYGRSWSDCLQFLNFDKNSRLRKMLLVGQGTLCLVDSGDAFIRSGGSSNWIEFFSRMNFVAWMRFSYLGLRHAVALLQNEIEIQRYKLRSEAYHQYVVEITELVDKFLIEHNRKIDKYFAERKQELTLLFNDLSKSIKSADYITAVNAIENIGNLYGIQSTLGSFKDFKDLIDNDEY